MTTAVNTSQWTPVDATLKCGEQLDWPLKADSMSFAWGYSDAADAILYRI